MPNSRGIAISAYSAPFSKGAKIYGANIQSGVITSAHIADGTVVAADVAAGSITSAKLGAAAVTSAKIGAGAVTSAKIGSNNVHNANISAKSITSAKIRAAFLSGSIVSGKKTIAVAHGLGVKPKFVVVCPLGTLVQISGAQNANVAVAAASAATTANIYLIGSQTQNSAIKYAAYVQL